MDAEQWLTVPSWPDYEVSDLAQAWKKARIVETKNGQVRRYKAHLLTQSVNESGYHVLNLTRYLADGTKETKVVRVYNLVMEAFRGPRPEGMVVRHLNGNAGDSRLVNLAYGSYTDNKWDRQEHGTDFQLLKDRCSRGHLFAGNNLHVDADGHRKCKACAYAYPAVRNRVGYYDHPLIQEVSDRKYTTLTGWISSGPNEYYRGDPRTKAQAPA